MARPDLHLFERDLVNRPSGGSAAPPRTVRASALDGNFRKLTLLESNDFPKTYTVQYTAEGTRITGLKYIPDPPTTGTYVLGAIDGVIQWLATEDC